MEYTYFPHGVCSKEMHIDIDENGKIRKATILGGCHGNGQGVCRLVEGMDAKEVVKRIKGVDCHGRGTSCPDQLAIAIEEAIDKG